MAEAEKRWNATVSMMLAKPNPKAGEKDQADLILDSVEVTFEDINTPGANQYGYMVFAGRGKCTMIPVQDVKRIDLVELKVQAVTTRLRGV